MIGPSFALIHASIPRAGVQRTDMRRMHEASLQVSAAKSQRQR